MKLTLLNSISKFCILFVLGTFAFSLNAQITILDHPMTQTVCEGDTLMLSVSVSSPGTPTYEWYKDGLTLGVTTADYIKVNVATLEAGDYHVEIKDGTDVAISNTAVISVTAKPTIATQPNGTNSVCLGSNISLMGAVTNADLVWKRDGTTLAINNNTYTKTNVGYGDEGNYYILAKAMTGCKDIFSDSVYVNVDSPVIITEQPQGKALIPNMGLSHVMRVKAEGKGPFAYQWYKDNNPIPGANNDSFKIYAYTAANDSGVYRVEVSSSAPCNSVVLSNTAYITSTQCPLILKEPDTLMNVCENGPLNIEVEVVGAGGFQWAKHGVPLNGAIYSRYQVANSTGDEEGYYVLHIMPRSGITCPQLTSREVHVVVNKSPKFTLQPMMPPKCEATTHTITVNSTLTNSYKWYVDSVVDTSNMTNSYTLPVDNSIKTVYAVAVSTYCPPVKSNEVLVRQVDPSQMAHVYPDNKTGLVEQCTDKDDWTYYSHPSDMSKLLIGIRKNGNMANFHPEVKTTNGFIYESSPNNIEQKGVLLGMRQFNITLDSGQVITKPYDVKFMYTADEKTTFTDRINTLKLRTGINYSTDLPEKELSFIVSTQDQMDTSLLSSFKVPLNHDNAIVSDQKFGRYSDVLFVEINKLVASKGGGTFYFQYIDKSANSISSSINEDINIFPIPANNELTISVDYSKYRNSTISILDILGKEVFNTTVLDNETTIDISTLSSGTYILKVGNEENSHQSKISIER